MRRGRLRHSPLRITARPFRAFAACLVIASTTTAPASIHAAENTDLDGRTIVNIIFERYDIFDTSDPKTSKWPYRAANAIHIRSREGFIRSMLLFGEGDAYSEADAAESARLLRSLGIMNPVEIYRP